MILKRLIYYSKNEVRNENNKYYKFCGIEIAISNLLDDCGVELGSNYKQNLKLLEETVDFEFLNKLRIYNRRRLLDYYILHRMKSKKEDESSESESDLSEDSDEVFDELEVSEELGEESDEEFVPESGRGVKKNLMKVLKVKRNGL